MNYPIWEITTIGGGSLIALIAIFHVYISHLAVGGGMFIWLTDVKGYRDNDQNIHAYLKKHSWFFLYLTMVFGGVTGVGIWFIIALVNPAATSTLIHNFVFGWAIEWVFFVGEIVALLVYCYYFDRLERKHRLFIAFLYFLFAWLSLVIINGILAFMLTPGTWIETHNFWDGFLNPTYFSSLFFRTFMTMMIAGLFGYVTSVFIKDQDFRLKMMRYSSQWLLYPLIGLIPSAFWYYYSIPEPVRTTAFELNPQTHPFTTLFIFTSIILFISGVVLSLRTSNTLQKAVTLILLLIGLGWMAGFEYSREIARKPFIISDFMYSTSIYQSSMATLAEQGVLATARWSSVDQVTEENKLQAGKELFNLQCLSCHTVNGIRNDIVQQTEKFTHLGLVSLLKGQGRVQTYMPPFVGSADEMEALAAYLASLNPKEQSSVPGSYSNNKEPVDIPAFDKEKSKYVLLVWNDLGMHCISDSDPWFVIMPPANTLEAQLIKRGEAPEIISEGVYLSYQVEAGFENPANHVRFWEHSQSNFGHALEKNIGMFGKGMSGRFDFHEERNSFIAAAIPVVPYADDGSYNPYPYFTVSAFNAETDEVLISTKVVAPNSTEMGCQNCHGGGWLYNNMAGISDETAKNILLSHDHLNGTDLYEQAVSGHPKSCQSCHADPALAAEGDSLRMNLSTSMHGWHANYMPVQGAKACVLCHPANPTGRTQCFRGIHSYIGISCVDCHGELDEHALSLLKGQKAKRSAVRLMTHLTVSSVDSKKEVNPRWPWMNEPDCLTCHQDFQPPEEVNAYNQWTKGMDELYRIRTDEAGIRCIACHNSTHAIYPADNPLDKNRDNVQPLQYMGIPLPIGSNKQCETCHMVAMEDPVHHENMAGMFRNTGAFK